MKSIGINFMIEKREGHGEDSDPLYISKDNFYAVGVFDGMGGSGAAMCKSNYGDHTKAYVASRIVKDAVESYINSQTETSVIDANGIKQIIKSRLEQEKRNFPAKASGLRSRLVRDYPTTLALITSQIIDEYSSITSYWAGDSRNYLWNENGFFQISKDDLDIESDPLENLRNDSALSNCVCADRDFSINHKEIKVQGKYILISATDGCFGYLLTPMHFQNILLTGLQLSSNIEDWCEYIKEEFTKATGDDVSISLCAIGYGCFEELKETFKESKIVELENLHKIQIEINRLTAELEQNKAALENSIQKGWNGYKESYLKYFLDKQQEETQQNNIMPQEDK